MCIRLPRSDLRLVGVPGSRLAVVPEASINCLTALTHLDLGDNAITAVPPFGSAAGGLGLVALESVTLADNQIGALATDTFVGLANLQQLSLIGNLLTRIIKGTFSSANVPALRFLHLENNLIGQIPFGYTRRRPVPALT